MLYLKPLASIVELHSHTLGLEERARWKVVVEAPS
jgi:hypothetical protein